MASPPRHFDVTGQQRRAAGGNNNDGGWQGCVCFAGAARFISSTATKLFSALSCGRDHVVLSSVSVHRYHPDLGSHVVIIFFSSDTCVDVTFI